MHGENMKLIVPCYYCFRGTSYLV